MWAQQKQEEEPDPLDIKVEVILKEEKVDQDDVLPQQQAVDLKFDVNQIHPEEHVQVKCEEIHHHPVDNLSNIFKTEAGLINYVPFVDGEEEKIEVPSCTKFSENEDSFILPDMDSAQNYLYKSTSLVTTEHKNNINNNDQHHHLKVAEGDENEDDYEDDDDGDDLEMDEEDPLQMSDFACVESEVKSNQVSGSSKVSSMDRQTIAKLFRGTLPYKATLMGTWTKYECCTCGIKFGSYDNIRNHFYKKHEDDSLLRCDCCHDLLDSATLLDNHVCESRKIPSNLTFRYIGQGQYIYRERWKYEKKTESRTTGNELTYYKCLTCGLFVRRLRSIFAHLQKWHNGTAFCDVCRKSFDDEENLKRHLCLVSNTIFRHRYTFSENGDGKFIFYFKWPVHLEGNCYVCDTCGVKKKVKEKMAVHINSVHGEGRTKYPCGRCPKSFATPNSLKSHLAGHLARDKKNAASAKQKKR